MSEDLLIIWIKAKEFHKGHVFVLRQVNHKELESLQFTCLTDFDKLNTGYLSLYNLLVLQTFQHL